MKKEDGANKGCAAENGAKENAECPVETSRSHAFEGFSGFLCFFPNNASL